MSFTQTDLDNIQNAIMELARGQRVVRIRYSDGRDIEYGQTQLKELKELRAEIQAEIQSASGRRRFILTSTSKGL